MTNETQFVEITEKTTEVTTPTLVTSVTTKKKKWWGRGFTLTEAAIVLGIVGLILGGIWSAAGSTFASMRTSDANKQILAISQKVKNFYGAGPVDSGTMANQISQGIFPQDMVASGSAVNGWGGTVTFAGDKVASATANDGYTIQYKGIPQSQCADLVKRVGNGFDATLKGIANTGKKTDTAFPLTAAAALAICADATSAGNNITFTFSLL